MREYYGENHNGENKAVDNETKKRDSGQNTKKKPYSEGGSKNGDDRSSGHQKAQTIQVNR